MSERIEFDDLENLGPSETLGDELNARYNALKTVANESLAIIGAWDSGTNYYLNDGVTSGGVTWRSLQDDNVNHTPAEGAWWEKLAGDVVSSADFAAHTGNTTTAHGAVSTATASKIVVRDASGRAAFADPAAAQDAATKAYVDAKFLNLDWQEAVEDKDLATPPGSPATGARYIVAASPTGAWSGHAKDIAEWNGSAWIFATPTEGFATRVKNEDKFYAYDGSAWGVFGGGTGESVAKEFAQTAHGLVVQNVVRLSGGVLVKAQDDTAAHAEAVGVVSAVRDADHATVTFQGYIEGLSGLTADEGYFVGPMAGVMTVTAPTADGKVFKPVMVALSATQAIVLIQGGHVISTASYQPLDSTLTALAALDGTAGLLVETGPDTFVRRTFAGTAHNITVSNGDGVAGNPSVAVASDYAGNLSIANVGTINNGTWNATKIALAKGGTNADLSATGPGFLKQASAGADVTVAVPVAADISDFTAAVQALLSTLDVKTGYQYATATALPANTYSNGSSGVGATLTGTVNGPLSVDSILLPVGAKMLVKNEADATHNGWYVLTQQGVVAVSPYILTRATDADVAAEMGPGYLTPIEGPTGALGTLNNGTLWISLGPSPFVVGTSSITFAQEDASGAALKANNLSDLASASTARTNLGLGDSATKNTGTGSTNVATGDAIIAQGRFKSATETNFNVPGVVWPGAIITSGPGANSIRYFPMSVNRALTLDRIAVEITTAAAAGKLIRLAIYNADADWQPTTLVLDCGTVPADPGTVPNIASITINQALPSGRYLLMLHTDGAPTLRGYRGSILGHGLLSTLGATPHASTFSISSAYAVAASPGVTWDTTAGSASAIAYLVFVRVASFQ